MCFTWSYQELPFGWNDCKCPRTLTFPILDSRYKHLTSKKKKSARACQCLPLLKRILLGKVMTLVESHEFKTWIIGILPNDKRDPG